MRGHLCLSHTASHFEGSGPALDPDPPVSQWGSVRDVNG